MREGMSVWTIIDNITQFNILPISSLINDFLSNRNNNFKTDYISRQWTIAPFAYQ